MDHHFFGSTAMNWATGDSREEVLLKLWNATGATTIGRAHKEDVSSPFYAWTCMVEGGKAVPYEIEFFRPKGVKVAGCREYDLLPGKQWREIIRDAQAQFDAAASRLVCPATSTMLVPCLPPEHLTYGTHDALQAASQRIVQDGESNGPAGVTVAALSEGGYMLCFQGCDVDALPADLRIVHDWYCQLPEGAFHWWLRIEDMADQLPALPTYDHEEE